MRTITKFLLAVFSCAPIAVTAAPISTTAGSNLTGYNGSLGSVMNNAWNNASNPRANAQANNSAKADFDNCVAVVLRCATPKCARGGCTSMDVAKPIATGCVNSNSTCKKHGDSLADSVAAQLVASSTATANQQAAAAQASAAAAAEQSAQQIAAMQQQMTQQMQMMQEQNNAQIASLQSALEESRRETADAVQQAAAAGANVASAPDADTGLTAVQTAAAKSGVSEDVILRSTITGQILTSMEGVDTSLNNLKTTMREAFKYGKCNEVNGNNCTGPKRVKKFKELAMKFMEPYDALVENLDYALTSARDVGVDMTDIYMMLNGSCNRWGEYICQPTDTENNQRVYKPKTFEVCRSDKDGKVINADTCNCRNDRSIKKDRIKQGIECTDGMVVPPEADMACVLNKEVGEDQVKESWLYPEDDSKIRIGCASSALNGSIIGRRRAKNQKAGSVDIDILEFLISQDAPDSFAVWQNPVEEIKKYCAIDVSKKTELRSATVSKTLKPNICCRDPETSDKCTKSCEDEENSYINPIYALCSVHAYNSGNVNNDVFSSSAAKSDMKEIIGLKTTVVAQQMYKQYTSLESMIKRLKIMLEKATLKASLQVASGTTSGAGGTSDDYESESSADISFDNCEARSAQSALDCVRANYSAMKPMIDKNKITVNIRKQLYSDAQVLKDHLDKPDDQEAAIASCDGDSKLGIKSRSNALSCLRNILTGITKLDAQLSRKSSGAGRSITINYGNEE
ncbi:MAG: hypothetical protein IKP24_03355 [Alphaproteobacteria bacterium]|nr:hypothetical protein [Alphaproteobacteria bacterium]